MNNLTAFIIIAVICLVAGRRYDLCRVILLYYAAYFLLWPISLYSAAGYYAAQLVLDTAVILACCKISYFYKRLFVIPLAYAVIIFSSLVCDGLKLIDEAMGYYVLTELHRFRQQFSIPLDLIFATVGSNGARILLSYIIRVVRANIANHITNAEGKPKCRTT